MARDRERSSPTCTDTSTEVDGMFHSAVLSPSELNATLISRGPTTFLAFAQTCPDLFGFAQVSSSVNSLFPTSENSNSGFSRRAVACRSVPSCILADGRLPCDRPPRVYCALQSPGPPWTHSNFIQAQRPRPTRPRVTESRGGARQTGAAAKVRLLCLNRHSRLLTCHLLCL